MPAPSKQKAERAAAQVAYFAANGWPTNLDGTLTSLDKLDMAQLRKLVKDYGNTLQAEFESITPGRRK